MIRVVEYKGKTFSTVASLLRFLGSPLRSTTVLARMNSGWSLEQAVSVPRIEPRKAFGCVYLVTHHYTGRKYVGVTCATMENRWIHHVYNSARASHPLAHAIAADGPDAFTIEEIEGNVPYANLADRERHWIAFHKSLVPHGFNRNRGGALGSGPRTGFYDKADEIKERTGVCLNTARRWAREGEPESGEARVYRNHGLTGTREFRQWHDRRQKIGLSPEWQDFDQYRADIKLIAPNGERVGRIDKSLPWGPNNTAKVLKK